MDEGAEMGYSFVALIMEDFLKAAVILATRGQEKFNELHAKVYTLREVGQHTLQKNSKDK